MPSKFGFRGTQPPPQHPGAALSNASPNSVPPKEPHRSSDVVNSPPHRERSSCIDNQAFQLTLEQHVQNLDPVEREHFTKAQSIQIDDLLRRLESLDTHDGYTTSLQRYLGQLPRALELCSRCTNIFAVDVHTNPQALLLVGAIKLVIEVGQPETIIARWLSVDIA